MTVGIRHDDLRRRNRAMVIAAVRQAGRPSRTEIAGVTALSHSTISAIAADLIDEGVLVEVKGADTATARRGRPQVDLGPNPRAATVVAVLLSLNHLSAALIDYAGGVLAEEEERLATATPGKDELVAAVVAVVGRMVRRSATAGVMRISLAVQGVTDSACRTMAWSPITGHGDIRFADALEAAFGIPVTVENDCNMMAVALRWRDPARYRDNFIALLLSNGIGMGMYLNGQLFTGTHSSGAEFGHMIHMPGGALCRCGRRGCIEAYAGAYAIWRNASGGSETDLPAADIPEARMLALAEAARARDGLERGAYDRAGEAIGYGLGNLFALIDPAPVAFVGVGASAFDLMEGPLRQAIARTVGGQHQEAITFATEPNERPLIREGCAMRALTFLDQEVFAPGNPAAAAEDTPAAGVRAPAAALKLLR